MRSMTIFNFLLEATVIGSALILLMIALRKLLRDWLGSRFMYAAWLVAAFRLLLPLSLPNPAMDEFRPGFSVDLAARPMADQVRRRVIDAGMRLSDLSGSNAGRSLHTLAVETSNGNAGRWILLAWFLVAVGLGAWLLTRSLRFRRRVYRERISKLEGDALTQYNELCARYKVKPIPVYFVDRLSAACVIGVTNPYIALPAELPSEHLPLVLAHEICHRRSHDPFWGIVRNLCLVVHWFNPLVWLGAHLNRVDSEMACDDRVTSKLQDMDRLAYVNALVSTAGRSGDPFGTSAGGTADTGKHLRQRVTAVIHCVRGNRWVVALGSLAAAALLLASFATSESEPLPTIANIPAVTWTAAAEPLNTGDQAVARARRFLESPFIGEDTSRYAFAAFAEADGWRVEARVSPERLPVVLRFSYDGLVQEFDGTSALHGLSFTDTSYTHRTFTDSVEEYQRAFISALVPGQTWTSGSAVADVRAGRVRLLDSVMHDDAGAVVCQLTLQVEPTPRVLYFRSYTAMHPNG